MGKFCVTGSFGLLYLYTAEIFPTGVRNVTLGSCSMWARVGSILAPFMRDLLQRELLATDHVILNHGQVTWTTRELAPPLLTTTPHQREDVSALDRFNVHRCPTWRVLSGAGLELVTRQTTIRYLYHLGYRSHFCQVKRKATDLLSPSVNFLNYGSDIEASTDLTCILPPLHSGSSVVLAFEPVTLQNGVGDHNPVFLKL
ncbi:uncharacterized protein TNCV_631131 [Trichonephila clavipes]|nr:uncharacterized protein TNCV_631131 [Trichonephila clavipes]